MLKSFSEYRINEEAKPAKDVAKEENNLTGILNTTIKWYGEEDGKSTFYENFKKPVYSVRATFLNLASYAKKMNIFNVKEIIARWCLGKKSSDNMSKEDAQKLEDYLAAIKHSSGLDATTNIEYNEGKFVVKKENVTNLFKLVQGIILEESGQLDSDDLGDYKTVPQIVVGAFELETNSEESQPAYKKYGVDLQNEEYKSAKDEFLKGEKLEKPAEEKEKEKEKPAEKPGSVEAFKKLSKGFK